MLELKNINKSYGSNQVLENLNLEFDLGRIYGLLGRNGVGKTTLLNIISSQIMSNSGQVLLNGEDVFENPGAMDKICIIKESGFGVDDIKVKKIFKAAEILYKNWDEEYKDLLINEFNLNKKKNYSKLSKGNQTIVGLIIGLASRSPITIFDEPSLGLDAANRYKFYELLLKDVEEYPRTVIISTHLIDEVTNLFEEVVILKDRAHYIKDEVVNLMGKAYFLNGRLEKMESIIKNKNLIHREEFGTTTIIGIFDDLSKEETMLLKENSVDISPIPLQKLFILLTESKKLQEVR